MAVQRCRTYVRMAGRQGAPYYKVELSTSPTFLIMEATYTTYNTRITPVDTISHGIHYWRVSGVDADGHVGTSSTGQILYQGHPCPYPGQPCRWQYQRCRTYFRMAGCP